MFMAIKKNLFLLLLAATLFNQETFALAAPMTDENIVDDSLRDISMVLGIGAVGAILGLSTLSFVDNPSSHLKNVAVGGAIGIVIGVGVVVFSQATRSTSAIGMKSVEIPMNPAQFANLTRQEFSEVRIVKTNLPSLGYNFSF
jgi:hypothetical protein